MPEDLVSYKCACTYLRAVIIGSFRKHLPAILQIKEELEKKNILVLSPTGSRPVNKEDEFVIFDSDYITNPRLLQDSVFSKIRHSTFVVVANINGYIGKATILEIGYAIASNINIYTFEPTLDLHLSPYCKNLEEIIPEIKQKITNENKESIHYI